MNAIKSLVVALAALTGLCAILVAALSFVGGDGTPGWVRVKMIVCAVVIGQSALTIGTVLPIGALRLLAVVLPLRRATLIGALSLVPLGCAAILHTIHLGRVTGDLESWVLVIGLALVAQGALTAWLLAGARRRLASAALLALAVLAGGCRLQFAQPKSAIGRAAYEGRTDEVIALRAQGVHGGSGDHGFDALIWASRGGQAETVKALLAAGADPNALSGINGWNALMHAIHKDHLEAARALIDGGADVNFRANHGATPLMLAAGQSEIEVVRLLLARGADPRAVHSDGATALSNAVAVGSAPIVRMLLEAAPDLRFGNSLSNRVSVWLARLRGRGEIVALVEGRGAGR